VKCILLIMVLIIIVVINYSTEHLIKIFLDFGALQMWYNGQPIQKLHCSVDNLNNDPERTTFLKNCRRFIMLTYFEVFDPYKASYSMLASSV